MLLKPFITGSWHQRGQSRQPGLHFPQFSLSLVVCCYLNACHLQEDTNATRIHNALPTKPSQLFGGFIFVLSREQMKPRNVLINSISISWGFLPPTLPPISPLVNEDRESTQIVSARVFDEDGGAGKALPFGRRLAQLTPKSCLSLTVTICKLLTLSVRSLVNW